MAWTGVAIGIVALLGVIGLIFFIPAVLIGGQINYHMQLLFFTVSTAKPGSCGTSSVTPGIWTTLAGPLHGTAFYNWANGYGMCGVIATSRLVWGCIIAVVLCVILRLID